MLLLFWFSGCTNHTSLTKIFFFDWLGYPEEEENHLCLKCYSLLLRREKQIQGTPGCFENNYCWCSAPEYAPPLLNCIIGAKVHFPLKLLQHHIPDITFPSTTSFELWVNVLYFRRQQASKWLKWMQEFVQKCRNGAGPRKWVQYADIWFPNQSIGHFWS